MRGLAERIDNLAQAVPKWLTSLENGFGESQQENDFCLKYLSCMCSPEALKAKTTLELGGRTWSPLGRLLIVVSEQDRLGTALAFMAAYLTGNSIKIKARETAPALETLREALHLKPSEAEIGDWSGAGQNDETILKNVDGVLLAGGEALISHYRRVVPPNIRLIEFGPKISLAAIKGRQSVDGPEWPGLINTIIQETTLFRQDVCSAPRFFLVEDHESAVLIFEALKERLSELTPLPFKERLGQKIRFAELDLMKRLASENDFLKIAHCPKSGWGATLSDALKPAWQIPKGFQIISGSLDEHLAETRRLWPGRLQTLGVWGPLAPPPGFSRICPLGKMHLRPAEAPHDGFFELAALVSFISLEI